MSTKKCPRCGEIKPYSGFYKNKTSKDGLQSWCKICLSKATKRNRQGLPSDQAVARQKAKKLLKAGRKKCSSCGEIKSVEDFYRNAARKDGFDDYCRLCRSVAVRKYNRTPKGRRVQVEAQLRWQKNNWEEKKTAMREYYRLHPKRTAARSAVSNAVASGRLPRASTKRCVKCGCAAEHYHHHNGYEQEHWLDVVPICSTCHGKEHREGSQYDAYI